MGKHAFLLILLSLVAIGCAKRDELYTVKPDVTLRFGAPDPCSYCKLARYYSDNGKVSDPQPVGPQFIEANDIKYVGRSYEPADAILIVYKGRDHRRILQATSKHEGDTIFVMSGEKIISIVRGVGPFSKGSQIGDLTPSEADYIISQISQDPYTP